MASGSNYVVGQRIEGLFDQDWYPGTISHINANDTFVVEFDDGDRLEDAQSHELRIAKGADESFQEDLGGLDVGIPVAGMEEDGFHYKTTTTSPTGAGNRLQEEDDDDDFKYKDKDDSPDTEEPNAPQQPALEANRHMSGLTEFSDSELSVETPIDDAVLGHINEYLLPSYDNVYFVHKQKDAAANLLPTQRLQFLMYQITVAEHVRSLQCLYMDSEDELMLAGQVRRQLPGFSIKLPTNVLMQMITEGRARILSLVKLNFGLDSHLRIRAVLELANSYALQGLWEQVSDYVRLAGGMLEDRKYLKNTDGDSTRSRRRLEARLVSIVHSCLRDFCVLNNGQVTEALLEELAPMLQEEVKRYLATEASEREEKDAIARYPKRLINELRNYLIKCKYGSWSGQNLYEDPGAAASSTTAPSSQSPSWGDVIDFLRRDCTLMKAWMQSVHLSIAPQSLAVLNLVLMHADALKKGVLYPAQLTKAFMEITAASRLIVGSGIYTWFSKLITEVRVLVNTQDACLSDIALGKTEYAPHHRRVSFLLPIAFEELIAKYSCDNIDDNMDLLRSKLLTLEGMIHVFSQTIAAAEDSFIKALRSLEALGVEMDVIACELYNSIAQLMITKHRHWQEQHKKKVRGEAMQWLSTAEGQVALQQEIVKITKSNTKATTQRSSREEIDIRAYKSIFQERMRQLKATAQDPTITSVEAASRYLVRSFEIIERSHGQSHPSYGASCIAVASVKNIIGDYELTREWLTRALRSMEKLDPLPERAIAFVQTQVSNAPCMLVLHWTHWLFSYRKCYRSSAMTTRLFKYFLTGILKDRSW